MKSKKDKQKKHQEKYTDRDKQTNMQVERHTLKYFLSDEVGQMKMLTYNKLLEKQKHYFVQFQIKRQTGTVCLKHDQLYKPMVKKYENLIIYISKVVKAGWC